MKIALFCGFNGFHQFGTAHAKRTEGFSELSSEWLAGDNVKYAFSWSFNVLARGRDVTLSGFVEDVPGNQKTFTLTDEIKSVGATHNYCLVLLSNGKLYRINAHNCLLEELNFTNVERPRKRSIFGEEKDQDTSDPIDLIACGRYMCVAITKNKCVYNVPSKIYEFPLHVKVKELVCGFEHALALTGNGDVYSWGNGLRGQLGHPELKVEEAPKLIDALAGVKMVAISAGGWHSAAISSFGDLYLWGSNINGQLGVRVYSNITSPDGKIFERKNPTVYALPQVIESGPCCANQDHGETEADSCNVSQVACGARHTFIRNECGRVYYCGWNEHNQLGQGRELKFVDEMREFTFEKTWSNCTIYCGPWCTLLVGQNCND